VSSFDQTFTDIDEYVTLRCRDDAIVVEVSVMGFRQPPNEIARRIVETAERLPRPDAEAESTLAESLAAISSLREAMATGGYAAFDAMARRQLGIGAPAGGFSASPDHDRALAEHLGGVIETMRATAASHTKPETEPIVAEAATSEGDIVVVTSTERTIAEVKMSPAARQRGVEGLGETLTELVAKARTELRARTDERVRGEMPTELVETIETGPAETEAFALEGLAFIEHTRNLGDDLKRRINERS
jgi:hypothetical protein